MTLLGFDPNYENVARLSEQIKTFNEQLEDNGELQDIRTRISEAKRIIFLGFHFHRQNMVLLHANGPIRDEPVNVYAAGIDRSASDQHIIDGDIRRMLSERGSQWNVQVNDLDCKGLFKYFGTAFAR